MMDPLATGDIGEHAPRGVRHPAVRASAVQDSLAFLDTFEPGAQARVLDLVPRTVLQIKKTACFIKVQFILCSTFLVVNGNQFAGS